MVYFDNVSDQIESAATAKILIDSEGFDPSHYDKAFNTSLFYVAKSAVNTDIKS